MKILLSLVLALVWMSPVSASPATDAFASLKALAGSWEVTEEDGATSTASYEVVSGGSTVLERLFGMVTAYHLDGDELVATHYCHAQNQPRFRLATDGAAGTLRFVLTGVGNLPDPQAPYMAGLSFTLAGPDRFSQTWTLRSGGQDQEPFTLAYRRLP